MRQLLSLLLLLSGAGAAGQDPLPVEERWVVTFASRSFDLVPLAEARRCGAAPAAAAAIVAELEAQAAADQADFAAAVARLGGRVTARWWLIPASAVAAPPGLGGALAALPGVAAVTPDRILVPHAPIQASTSAANHAADALQAVGVRGRGSVLASLDTGLDLDCAGQARPHATFYVNGDLLNLTGGGLQGSRLLAAVKVGALGPDDVTGHGTGVAGIAAGEKWNTAAWSDRGHAPLAGLVGYAIADQPGGGAAMSTVISAWQQVAADRVRFGILVANHSFSGSPDPLDPAQQALDTLALQLDVLPVVSAGNDGAQTVASQAAVNGLAVGAVAAGTRAVASWSSRGPLSGDAQRFYPDLCAVGVNVVMPRADNEAGSLISSGTSLAAPQAAGAALLFRSLKPAATALETKAALLATTEDVAAANPNPPYNTRNAYGVGFLRDDRLADLARGAGLAGTWTLTRAAPSRQIPFAVTGGKAYAVVAAWNRHVVASRGWSDLDLQVRSGAAVVASSATPRNVYEKVVFLAPATGTVQIELLGRSLEVDPLPVAVAAVEVPPPFQPGTAAAYGAGCLGTGALSAVVVVAPKDYAGKWGEGAQAAPLGWVNHRFQAVYAATALPAAFTARGLAFRPDESLHAALANQWVEVSFQLGPAGVDPAGLGTSFAGNAGGPLTAVVARRRVHLPWWPAPAAYLADWVVQVPFDQPYAYIQVPGRHLLVEGVRHDTSLGNADLSLSLDAVRQVGVAPAVSSLLAPSPAAATGTLALGQGPVIGFLDDLLPFAVPYLAAEGMPLVGQPLRLALTGARALAPGGLLLGLSDQSWAGLSLPFPLYSLGAPGCSLLAGPAAILPLAADGSGRTAVALAVPAGKELIGATLFAQVLVLDPPANAAGLALSQGLKLGVGGQP